MSGLPLAAKTSITSLLVAALGLALIVLVRGPQLESGDAIMALVIGGSTTAAWLRPVHFASRTKLYVDTAITFAAVLILPLPLAMLATGLGTLLAHYLGRATRDVDHAVFNSSQVTLQAATGATLLAAGGWDVSHPTFTSADLPLFAVAGGVMYLVNTLAVAGIVALRTGQPLRRVWTGTTLYPDRTGAVSHLSMLGLGLLASLLVATNPWALLLLAPLTVAVLSILEYHVGLRLRAEEALSGSEASLAEAQRIAGLGSWDWEIDSGRQRWSDETYRMLGVAPRSFPATRDIFLNCVHAEDRRRVAVALETAVEQGTPYSLDHRVVLPDGSERIVHAQGEVLLAEDGRATRMVGTLHDVTERKALETQLAHRAFHDPLTDLPNRALFTDRLERTLARADDGGGRVWRSSSSTSTASSRSTMRSATTPAIAS